MRTLLSLAIMLTACAQQTSENVSSPTPTGVAAAATPGGPGGDTVVASWDGGQMTLGELHSEMGGSLTKLEIDYLQGKYEAESGFLENKLAESLLKKEAAAQGLDMDGLVKKEIQDKVSDPTEAEINEAYNIMKRRMRGAPLEEVRDQIVDMVRQRNEGERFSVLVESLRNKYKASVNLPYPDLPKIQVSVDDDPSKGPAEAKVTIVQFAEFQCPYCGKAKETVDQLLKDYDGQVNMVFRDFPLGFHDRAIPAAVAANCAGEQGQYWPMFDLLMTNQRKLSDSDLEGFAKQAEVADMGKWKTCLKDPMQEAEVKKDQADGAKAGVTGTPAFFVNGVFLSGAQPYDTFKAIIDKELSG